MPTDASIPLSFRPAVPLEDPQSIMAKQLGLQNQRQQSQVYAQQLQEGALGLQEKQRQIEQTAAVNQAYSDAFKVDPATGQGTLDTDSLTRALASSGHGVAIPGIVKATTDAQKAVADLAEQKSKVDVLQRNAGGSIGAAVLAADGDPNLFLNLASHALVGNANASTVQPILDHVQQLMQQDPTGAAAKDAVLKGAKILIAHSPEQTKLQAEADTAAARKKTADSAAAAADAKLPGEQATAQQQVRANAAGMLATATDAKDYAAKRGSLEPNVAVLFPDPKDFDPAKTPATIRRIGMTAEQQNQADQAAATAKQTKDNEDRIAKQRDEEIKIRQQEVNRQQKQFDATFGQGLDANGHPLSPQERKNVALQDPTAVAMANYQIPPPSSRASAVGKAQYDKVLAIDPTYDGTKFAERSKIAQDFSASGASGKAITSADTALAHLGAISQAGEALKNGDIKALNAIANTLGAQVGGSAKNTYDTITSMVAPEISKAVIGESGGEGERQAMQRNFASDTSDSVREQAIASAAKLLGARVHKQAQAYEADMGKPLARKLSPESQALLDKYSGTGSAAGGDMITVKLPDGRTGQIHATQKDRFLKDNPGAKVQ